DEIGRNTRRHVLQEHRLDLAASRYREFISSLEQANGSATPQANVTTDIHPGQLPSVYVVVLNYNGAKHIDVCLESLLAQSYPNTNILMVDNASPDGSGEYAQKKYPQVESILCKENLGFARGNNLGFDHVLAQGADYVIALNNDVEVDRDWVTRQVEAMQSDPGIGACGSRILSYWQRDIVNSLGHEMNQWGHTWDIGFGRRFDPNRWGKQQEIVSICGCSFMIRREVLEKVKGFDPKYFAYYDDVDLSIRIRGLGYRLVYVPDAIVYHKFSASFGHESPRKLALCTVNKWRFMFCHFPLAKTLSVFPRQFKRDAREALRLLRLGESRNTEVLLKALWQFLKMFPGLILYRLKNRWNRQHYSFLKMCVPTNQVPHFFPPRQDYELLREKSDKAPSRIMMGHSDDFLGEGWFPAESGYYSEAVRWMSKSASAFLKSSPEAGRNRVLQLHVRCPHAFLSASVNSASKVFPTLAVFVEGERVGEYPIGIEWRTIQCSLGDDLPDVVRVDLGCDPLLTAEHTGELRDVTVQLDEISLLDQDSPLLRRTVDCISSGAVVSASSVAPNLLRADIHLDEFPIKAVEPSAPFEIAITVRNTGDTCWIAQPLAKGGYVTMGIQLLDADGVLINADFGRQVLSESLFPGACAELAVSLCA
ncbi:MAG TPA: glycosyltransferase family 2 protein, partial [bacterium]|nr:glycosyltransferase family 2 protein [bacterium]